MFNELQNEDGKNLRALWIRSPIGCAIVSKEGGFNKVNPAYSLLTGYSETELLEKTFQEITHPHDLVGDVAAADNLISDNQAEGYTMVKRYIRKDGRIVWVELHVSGVYSESNEFLHFLVFAVPLPNAGDYKVETSDKGLTVRPSINILKLILDNKRESFILLMVILALTREELALRLLHLVLGNGAGG